jgi:hypothetical protein
MLFHKLVFLFFFGRETRKLIRKLNQIKITPKKKEDEKIKGRNRWRNPSKVMAH